METSTTTATCICACRASGKWSSSAITPGLGNFSQQRLSFADEGVVLDQLWPVMISPTATVSQIAQMSDYGSCLLVAIILSPKEHYTDGTQSWT